MITTLREGSSEGERQKTERERQRKRTREREIFPSGQDLWGRSRILNHWTSQGSIVKVI